MGSFFRTSDINRLVGGVSSAIQQNILQKNNEKELSSIESAFNSIISCQNKEQIENILGEGKVEKILKDSYIKSYLESAITKRSQSESNFNVYGGRTYMRNQKISIQVKYNKIDDSIVEIIKKGF